MPIQPSIFRKREKFSGFAGGRGHFDVCFECSGSPQAVTIAVDAVQPGGKLVLVGLGGETVLRNRYDVDSLRHETGWNAPSAVGILPRLEPALIGRLATLCSPLEGS